MYPFLQSGIVIASDYDWGLFVLQPDLAAVARCDDGLDNDGDGLTDTLDPGCGGSAGVREDPQCQDGLNNDNSFGTDFDGGESILGVGNGDPNGADPQCTSAWWNKEAATATGGSCGLGPELALVLAGVFWVRVRMGRS